MQPHIDRHRQEDSPKMRSRNKAVMYHYVSKENIPPSDCGNKAVIIVIERQARANTEQLNLNVASSGNTDKESDSPLTIDGPKPPYDRLTNTASRLVDRQSLPTGGPTMPPDWWTDNASRLVDRQRLTTGGPTTPHDWWTDNASRLVD
ncbi:hypothetical protein NDU88_000582 [Pleurodeles waltl]|uniref:Uncharacterized protein n=1 Tax=Pleurodeles waltl TaxID=8319 RepID=A0AAV7V5T3_PLEWA|nr:hypothetical protein NDU88_000582 [Pleurodeles waltl]